MKRIAALILLAALMLSLCACAAPRETTPTDASPEATGPADASPDATKPAGTYIVFETEDLDGNSVKSSDIFGKNRITMINVWGSWCGPCQRELPELELLSAELDELGCGLIGLLDDSDTSSGVATAKELVSQLGLTYPMLASNDAIRAMLPIQYYPTTFFVDSEGRLVGDKIIGAQVSAYLPAVKALLENAGN